MKHQNSDVIDIALSRLLAGESASTILADFPDERGELGPLLETATALKAIHPVTMPSQEAYFADRHEYLATVASLSASMASPGLLTRFRDWISDSFPTYPAGLISPGGRHKRVVAFSLITAMVVVLLVGTLGGTVVIAAESLPGSVLYPLKLTVEQVRLAMVTESDSRAEIYLTQAQERIHEVAELAARGETPDTEIVAAAQFRFDKAFDLASQTSDSAMLRLLIQARQIAQSQEETLAQTRKQVSEPAPRALRQAEVLLVEVRQMAEAGLEDPRRFQRQFSGGKPPDCGPNSACDESCGDGNCPQTENAGPDTKNVRATPEKECSQDDCGEQQTRVPVREQIRPNDGCGHGDCEQTQTPASLPTQTQPGDGCDQGRCSETDTLEPGQKPDPAEDDCGRGGCQSKSTQQSVRNTPQTDQSCGQADCQPSRSQQQSPDQVEPISKPTPTPAPTMQPTPEPTPGPDSHDDGTGAGDEGISNERGGSESGGDSGSGGGSGSSSDSRDSGGGSGGDGNGKRK